MSSPLSSSIREQLNKAALKGSWRELEPLFIDLPYTDLEKLFTDRTEFCRRLREIALNGRAKTFALLLDKCGHAEDCLDAMIKGFEADEKYASDSHMPWSVQPDAKDLDAKRKALRDFAVKSVQTPPESSRSSQSGDGLKIKVQKLIIKKRAV